MSPHNRRQGCLYGQGPEDGQAHQEKGNSSTLSENDEQSEASTHYGLGSYAAGYDYGTLDGHAAWDASSQGGTADTVRYGQYDGVGACCVAGAWCYDGNHD